MSRIQTPQQFLFAVLHVFFKWKILTCATFVITFIAIIFGVFLIDPQWKATSKLLVQQNPKLQPVFFQRLISPSEANSRIMPSKNLVEVLTSRNIAKDVVKQFELDKLEKQKDKSPTAYNDIIKFWMGRVLKDYPRAVFIAIGLASEDVVDYEAVAIRHFQDDWLDVSASQDSDVVALSVWGLSPELATRISNYMVESVFAKTRLLTSNNILTSYNFVNAQVPVVLANLTSAENVLRAFRQKHSISEISGEINMKMHRLNDIEKEFARTVMDRRENAERIKELKGHLEAQEKGMMESGFIAGNSLIVNLKLSLSILEGELASMLGEKKASHPDIINQKMRIKQARENISSEIRKILGARTETMSPIYQDLVEKLINAEIDDFVFSESFAALDRTRLDLKGELSELNDLKTQDVRLRRDVEMQEELFKDLKRQLQELTMLKQSGMNEVNIRVLDEGYVPLTSEPTWPRWDVVMPVGLFLALAIALIAPFTIEFWCSSFFAEEVEEILERPISEEIFRV